VQKERKGKQSNWTTIYKGGLRTMSGRVGKPQKDGPARQERFSWYTPERGVTGVSGRRKLEKNNDIQTQER